MNIYEATKKSSAKRKVYKAKELQCENKAGIWRRRNNYAVRWKPPSKRLATNNYRFDIE